MELPTALPRDRSRPSAPRSSPARARSPSRRDRPPRAATISASSASWSTIACSITIASTTAFASAQSRSGTIVNLDEADHPFHIHTNPFLVTRINGVALAEPVWRDTVNVRGHGSVTLRSRFEDFTGRFVLHCHILNHEDIGMMQLIEVCK